MHHNKILLIARQTLYWLILCGTVVMTYSNYVEAGRISILQPDSTDFYKFYLSAKRLAQGQSPFWSLPKRQFSGDPCHPLTPERVARESPGIAPELRIDAKEDPCLGPNLNPPIFQYIASPLSKVSYKTGWWIWSLISLALTAASVSILLAFSPAPQRDKPLVFLSLLAASFFYFPSFSNFSLGQVGSLCFFLLTLSWALSKRGFPISSGLTLGILIGLKPFFFVLILLLALANDRRTALFATLGFVCSWAAGWVIYGTDIYQQYFAIASDVTWNGARWNGSWAGVIERLLSGQVDSTLPPGSLLAKLLYSSLSLGTILVVCCFFAMHRKKWESRQALDFVFSIGIPTSLIASPLGWSYYFPCLILSFFILWHQSRTLMKVRLWRIFILATVLLSSLAITNVPSPRPENPTVWWGIDSIYCYALIGLLLLGLCAFQPQKSEHK